MKFKKIYIEITNACNKNCSFCLKTKRSIKEMKTEEFEKVIKDVKNFTDYIYLHVKGEPLLHSEFKKIIDICDKNNIYVNITTNGSLLSKNKEIIKNSKAIRQINISLHSYKENDNFIDLFDTVKDLNETTKIYFVYRYWILNHSNLNKENYCLTNLFNYYKFSNDMKNKILADRNVKINNYLYINKDEEFTWPSLENNIYNEYGNCYGLKSHIGILSDGTVVPCCLDGEGIINLGNIFNERLKDILENEKTKKIVKGFNDNKRIEPLCKHCSFKNNI